MIFHNQQKIDHNPNTCNWWMNKQTMVNSCNKILHSQTKKQITDAYNNMAESQIY